MSGQTIAKNGHSLPHHCFVGLFAQYDLPESAEGPLFFDEEAKDGWA